MELRKVERDDFIEYHLTVRSDSPAQAYRELASFLASAGVMVLQEKVYGPVRDRDHALAVRRDEFAQAGLEADVPCAYLEGRCGAGDFRGVQILGFAPRPGAPVEVATVKCRNGVRGRQLSGAGYRILFLAAIDGTPAEGRRDQALNMLTRADGALAELGLSFRDVARTWIYLKDILDWYGDFNAIRTGFLNERGVTGREGHEFPASTGIQGTSAGEACIMDICALEADPATGIQVRPVLESKRQHAAFAYGSSFSRAAAVGLGGRRTVLISGTASIDTAGQTLHVGDREAQIVETLQCIAALIEEEGGGLADICSATVFGKDPETLEVFDDMVRRGDVPAFPHVPMLADVCRDELLIEIEALAVVGSGRDNQECS